VINHHKQQTNNKQQTTNNKQQTTNNKQQTTTTNKKISGLFEYITIFLYHFSGKVMKYINSLNSLILSLVICIVVFFIYLFYVVIPFEVHIEHSKKCRSNIEYHTLRNRLLRSLNNLDDIKTTVGILVFFAMFLSIPSLMLEGNYVTLYIVIYAILFIVIIAQYNQKNHFDQYKQFQKDLQLWIDETMSGNSIHKVGLEKMIQNNMNIVEGIGVYKSGEESNYVSLVELEKIRKRMVDATDDQLNLMDDILMKLNKDQLMKLVIWIDTNNTQTDVNEKTENELRLFLNSRKNGIDEKLKKLDVQNKNLIEKATIEDWNEYNSKIFRSSKNSTYMDDFGKINHYRKTIPYYKQGNIEKEFYNDIYGRNGIIFNMLTMLFTYISYSLLSFSVLLF
tara:strand:+ start:545 stop:1723 length:1179 start_codon:yes stop_codon:yes gene_type:complete